MQVFCVHTAQIRNNYLVISNLCIQCQTPSISPSPYMLLALLSLLPDDDLGPVHKQSQVNYNELELQFKSISSNFIGWICLQAHSYLAWLYEPGPEDQDLSLPMIRLQSSSLRTVLMLKPPDSPQASGQSSSLWTVFEPLDSLRASGQSSSLRTLLRLQTSGLQSSGCCH